MKRTRYYANILCKPNSKVYLVIVTDGLQSWNIHFDNVPLNVAKAYIRRVYNPREIFTSIIQEDK